VPAAGEVERGDAGATDMVAAGMVDLGQLVRQRNAGHGLVLVGFGGHHGSVIAADSWRSRAGARREPSWFADLVGGKAR
jgi:hypothetical protein